MAPNSPIFRNWLIYQKLPSLSLTGLYTLLVVTASKSVKSIQLLNAYKIPFHRRLRRIIMRLCILSMGGLFYLNSKRKISLGDPVRNFAMSEAQKLLSQVNY